MGLSSGKSWLYVRVGGQGLARMARVRAATWLRCYIDESPHKDRKTRTCARSHRVISKLQKGFFDGLVFAH